jgi:NAD(P)-dependent dehydrogenase (short-subunit alcohol dehydrogenase family)
MSKRTTLIAGATRGIGRAVADLCHARGDTIVGMARSAAPDDFPGECFQADLSDDASTAAALKEITANYNIDHMVYNAGVANAQLIEDVDLETFRQTIQINLTACVHVAQAVIPGMRERQYGRLVGISSRAALGRVTRTGYSAAKSAMTGMFRSWALELAEVGITANVLAPGPTATEMLKFNNPDLEAFAANVPMKRLAEPHEIAAAIGFFISEEASFVTGQTLFACGGSSVSSMKV